MYAHLIIHTSGINSITKTIICISDNTNIGHYFLTLTTLDTSDNNVKAITTIRTSDNNDIMITIIHTSDNYVIMITIIHTSDIML